MNPIPDQKYTITNAPIKVLFGAVDLKNCGYIMTLSTSTTYSFVSFDAATDSAVIQSGSLVDVGIY